MEPTKLFIYLLASFGFAAILGHSAITVRFRRWLGGVPESMHEVGKNADGSSRMGVRPRVPGALGPVGDFLCELIECPMCLVWWTGVAAGVTVFAVDGPFVVAFGWCLVVGFFTSASNFILARVTNL